MIALIINYFKKPEPPAVIIPPRAEVLTPDGEVIPQKEALLPALLRNAHGFRMGDKVRVARKGNIWDGRKGEIVGFKPAQSHGITVRVECGQQGTKSDFRHEELVLIEGDLLC